MMNDRSDKTEFLFESDAEKVILQEAVKPKRKKIYKIIITNTIILSIMVFTIFVGLQWYEQKELEKFSASVLIPSNTSDNSEEKLNSASNLLESYVNNYSKKYEIIINAANPISEEQISNYNLVEVKDNLFNNVKLEEETYKHYLSLKQNLLERGYYINIKSGFRALLDSEIIYNDYVIKNGKDYADKHAVKPGFSEHNSGLAFDFVLSTDKYATKTNYNSAEYEYLKNTAYLYGFIFRYPKDKENLTGYFYEPWHLRYVGKDLAKYLKKNNLCLEEYYEYK